MSHKNGKKLLFLLPTLAHKSWLLGDNQKIRAAKIPQSYIKHWFGFFICLFLWDFLPLKPMYFAAVMEWKIKVLIL